MSGYYHGIKLTDFLLALNKHITPINHYYYRNDSLIDSKKLFHCNSQNAFLLSLEGLKKGTLLNFIEYGNKRYKMDKINLCVDNDKSGITFAKEFEKYEKFERIQPKNKDWNEDLISKIEKKTKGIER